MARILRFRTARAVRPHWNATMWLLCYSVFLYVVEDVALQHWERVTLAAAIIAILTGFGPVPPVVPQ